MKCEHSLEDHFYGVATVGERGQIVIPADARKKMGMNPGDKLMVLAHPSAQGLILIKIDAMREFVSTFLEELSKIEELSRDGEEVPGASIEK